jgi:hypothetical protein
VVVALADRLRDRVPRVPGASASDSIGLSVMFGVVSASFLMIDGALGMTALPQLAHMDVHSETVDAAYLATLGVRNGIDRVIPLTLGIWALTAHWPAWRHQSLPRSLTAAGLGLGAAGLAGAVVPSAGLVTLVLGVVWAAGFAVLQAVDGEGRKRFGRRLRWRLRRRAGRENNWSDRPPTRRTAALRSCQRAAEDRDEVLGVACEPAVAPWKVDQGSA